MQIAGCWQMLVLVITLAQQMHVSGPAKVGDLGPSFMRAVFDSWAQVSRACLIECLIDKSC